jgi:hypothetical protein
MRRNCSDFAHAVPLAFASRRSSGALPADNASKNLTPSTVSGTRRGLPALLSATSIVPCCSISAVPGFTPGRSTALDSKSRARRPASSP